MTDTLVPVTLIEDPFDGIVPGAQGDRGIQAKVRLPDAAVLAVIAARLDQMEGGKSSTGEVLKSMPGEVVLAYTVDRNVAETIRRLHAGASCFVHPVIEEDRTTIFVLR
jgi:hypothetical protein